MLNSRIEASATAIKFMISESNNFDRNTIRKLTIPSGYQIQPHNLCSQFFWKLLSRLSWLIIKIVWYFYNNTLWHRKYLSLMVRLSKTVESYKLILDRCVTHNIAELLISVVSYFTLVNWRDCFRDRPDWA